MQVTINSIFIDELKKIPSLVHATSPRYFETSNGEKGALQLGLNSDSRSLPQHREWFLRSLNIESNDAFLVKQIHSDRIFVLMNSSLTSEDLTKIEADAIVTCLTGKPIGVLTADCIPIIVYDKRLHVLGTVHAGRKGTAQNILSKTIAVLRDAYGSRPENILVGMGPGIGGCCYEVDEPCIQPFMEKYRGWTSFVKNSSGNKYTLDLFCANKEDALNTGVLPKNIFQSGKCTSCLHEQLYSYRREGTTGRLLTVAMLRPIK